MQLPEKYNYRIIRKYNVLDLLEVYDTENVINIKDYPIIMTFEKEKPDIITNNEPINIINPEVTNKFACDICNKLYLSKSALNAHKKKHFI